MRNNNFMIGLLVTASVFAAAQPASAQGQGGTATEDAVAEDEIVVTARRRDETLISVPVVVTAVSGDTLAKRGVTNLDGLARIVPQLLIAPQGGSVQGGNISIRGIAGPDSNPFGDQAVSFTVDGVQIAKASVRRMTDFDTAQVEVLKGPQALFFGKNSMAGIVNIRTADPGDHLEFGGKIGYEFEAREMRAEAYISAPLSESLGLRIAGQYSDMQGYLIDQTPKTSIYFNDARNPGVENYGIRGTLKYDPGTNFDAKLKVTYGRANQNGPAATTAFVSCPLGARQFSFIPVVGDNSQCNAGKFNTNPGYGPVVSTIPATLNFFRPDGKNFSPQKQLLSGLVMNFRPSEKLTITSASGYYKVDLDQCQNYENSFAVILPSCNTYHNKEFSQELNFVTDLGGAINFSGGLYFADTKATTGSLTYLFGGQFDLLFPGFGGPNTPAQVNNYLLTQKGSAYSAFLSMSFKPTETLEFSAGGRYSYEKKRLTDVRTGGGIAEVFNPAIFQGILDASTVLTTTLNANGYSLSKDRDNWDDFSPEATITYRPDENLTMFASYKHGFLSGGFNSSSVNLSLPNLDLSYKPQTISGIEAGVKARVADGALLLNAAAYSYKIKDLQVVNFTNATSTIRNAAAAKVEGFEADFNYRTPLSGLNIYGAAAYNTAKYSSFAGAPCYNGQTPAMGCNIVGGNPVQNLAGTAVARSPKWNVSGGFEYETPIGTAMKLGMTGGLVHSGSYLTDTTGSPFGRQPAYTLLDGSIRLGAEDDQWQLALIGRNLTNKFYFVASSDVPFTGGGTGTAAGLLGDRFSSVSRGREIMIQASFKFGK
jgi:iron complex outermembrane recepter protein